MTKQELITRKEQIYAEIKPLPPISATDEDGETNDDAYQEKLEQSYYIDELREQLFRIKLVLSGDLTS